MSACVMMFVAKASAQEENSARYDFYAAVETGYEFFAKTYRHSGQSVVRE